MFTSNGWEVGYTPENFRKLLKKNNMGVTAFSLFSGIPLGSINNWLVVNLGDQRHRDMGLQQWREVCDLLVGKDFVPILEKVHAPIFCSSHGGPLMHTINGWEIGYTPENFRKLLKNNKMGVTAFSLFSGIPMGSINNWLVVNLDDRRHRDMSLQQWREVCDLVVGKESAPIVEKVPAPKVERVSVPKKVPATKKKNLVFEEVFFDLGYISKAVYLVNKKVSSEDKNRYHLGHGVYVWYSKDHIEYLFFNGKCLNCFTSEFLDKWLENMDLYINIDAQFEEEYLRVSCFDLKGAEFRYYLWTVVNFIFECVYRSQSTDLVRKSILR